MNENSLSFPFQVCVDAGLVEPASTTECVEDPCPGEIVFRYEVGTFSEVCEVIEAGMRVNLLLAGLSVFFFFFFAKFACFYSFSTSF